MRHLAALQLVLCLVATATASHASVPHQTCIPTAFGVPTRPGPPNWFDPVASGGDPSLDDPRWNQASGQSFALGGALAPLHVRTLWSTVAGKDYLYLSFISDLDPNTTVPRDIFLGFRRANSNSGQFGYIFQFHLGASGATNAEALNYCGRYEDAVHHDCPKASNWWRMFLDSNGDGVCGDDGLTGEQYTSFNGASVTTPPVTWMANSVHIWQLGAGGPLQNRWAVQARIQLADANHPISEGIEKGSTFWYEGTAELGGLPFASIGKFPAPNALQTGVTTSICPNISTQDFLIHKELGSAPACTTCSPDNFAKVKTITDPSIPAQLAGCDAGLKIASGNIGSLYDPASSPGFNVDTNSPPTGFSAPAVNKLIAQVQNTTGGSIDVPLMARFRLANWGTTVFSTGSTDIGTFDPIPGTENGVCAVGAAPSCAGSFPIPAGGQKAITFNWTLTDNDKCSYQIPGSSCLPLTCTCDHTGASPCDPDPNTPVGTKGTRTTVPGSPCVKLHFTHECMYVEITAPNGGATFVQQSAYNNMNFGELSVLAREALIDARKLPTVKGQTFQDIYLLVMPRNMPASVPPTTTTVALVQNAAIDAALRIAQPYVDDLNRQQRDPLAALANRPEAPAINIQVPPDDKRISQILLARRVMPKAELVRVDGLLGIAFNDSKSDKPSADQVRNAVTTLGPEAAAEIVPTLDIYPFYLPGARGHAYQPMTAFTVFLSHESTLAGMHYEIDGATKVSENVYHLKIPVGNARKIQVRAQAVVGAEAVLTPGNAKWPCAGGCATCGGGANRNCGLLAVVGNTAPGILAGVFVIGRRRRRRHSGK
jgi:hypothetical protein